MATTSRPPRDLPQVSDSVDPAIRNPLSRVIEEVQRLMEFRGDPIDAALTIRKAMARGLLDSAGRARTGDVTYVNQFPSSGEGGGTTPDLTPPPDVGDLAIVAGFAQVLITWTGIGYTQGHGNKQTVIYAVKKDPSDPTLPTAGEAVVVAVAPHALTIISLPSEMNTRWHVWAKFESNDGVLSTNFAGGTNGVQDTTGQDIQQLLDVMTGQIRESHLYRALAEPIRSIIKRADDAAEDALKAALTAHQASQRAKAAILAEAAERGTAISQTQQLIAEGDSQLASLITLLTAAVATNRTEALAAVEDEAEARAYADNAEATQRTTLATQLRGAYTGTDVDSVTSGLMFSERQARSTADGAQVARLDVLEASVDDPTTGLLARATALEAVTTHVTSGNAALATRAATLEAAVSDPTTGLEATADALDAVETEVFTGANRNEALATRISGLETSVNDPSTGLLVQAAALDEAIAEANTDIGALVTRTTTLEARVETPSATPGDPGYNATYAALQIEAGARASLDGSVHALYTLRTEVSSGGRTMIGGFGLAATSTASAGPRIDFGIRADQFYIGAPSGSGVADAFPLLVRTSTTTENGVSIPAGVYIDSAFIVNVSALYGRFGTLVADSIAAAEIDAAQITFGSMNGDRILVNTLNGNRILANTITAAHISVTNLAAISANLGTITAGTLTAGTVFAGALSAATGTFAGDLSAATGTFSGGLNVKSATSGARLEITTSVIKVYDEDGNLRVKIGNLA